MSQSVGAVVDEGGSDGSLDGHLGGERKGSESAGDGSRLNVESNIGSKSVGDSEKVDGSSEGNSGNTVHCGHVPGKLGLVDAQVGSDGALLALLDEEGVGLSIGGLGGGSGGASGGLAGGKVRLS
jgi:hypothetical protein